MYQHIINCHSAVTVDRAVINFFYEICIILFICYDAMQLDACNIQSVRSKVGTATGFFLFITCILMP
jgi:hypothetical protein